MWNRSLLKWLHWGSFALIAYFFFVEPENVHNLGAVALATHAGMGVILSLVVGFWIFTTLRKGMAGRPGPRLPGWGKTLHRVSHRILLFGASAICVTGALAGFAAPYVVMAFGRLPISTGAGTAALHDRLTGFHELAFDLLMIMIIAHAIFHIWRHTRLGDNALRIMAPKVLHRFL